MYHFYANASGTWWGYMDLNHEPSDYESDALTN